jgi:hypothetical protein
MKQLLRLWHNLIGDQKFIETADYYAQRVRTMLEEEAKVLQLSEGPFSSDIKSFRDTFGKFIGAGMYDHLHPLQVTEHMRQEEHKIAYGNRKGLHLVTLGFKKSVDASSLRQELDILVGENPNLGEDGINTLLYVLPAPQVFLAREHKQGYGLVCSGRTNDYRAHNFESRARTLIEDATNTLQKNYGENLLVKTTPRGYMPSFLIPDLAKVLDKRGINLPSTG